MLRGWASRLLTRIGLTPETPYAPLVDKLASSGVWTNNHRGDGQASVAMIADATAAKNQNKRFPYGLRRYRSRSTVLSAGIFAILPKTRPIRRLGSGRAIV